jgi:23S rRNA pseudouridine1911/1915/1917 synthase
MIDELDDDDELLPSVAQTAATATSYTVVKDYVGERLDAAVAAIAGVTRAQAQRMLAENCVMVDGQPPSKSSYRMRRGDVVSVTPLVAQPLLIEAENIPLDILYEDADVVVVNKAAGMVVHPAIGHGRGTLVNALMFHCRDLSGVGGVLRPGIVHRLDKDTSGVMVVSKNDEAHLALAEAFAAKSRGESADISRQYLAICAPGPRPNFGQTGTIRTLYGRHPINRKEFSSKVNRGKAAVTHWEVHERFTASAIVSFRLETGRTHQIRVHAADAGFAVLGDQMYGHRQKEELLHSMHVFLQRQALHAATLDFVHPRSKQAMSFSAPLPADMQHVIETLRAAFQKKN